MTKHSQFIIVRFSRSRVSLFTFAIILSIASVSLGGQNGKTAVPVFAADKIEHNFGDIFTGEDVSYIFTVRNLGNAPLQLSDSPVVSLAPRDAATWGTRYAYENIKAVSFRVSHSLAPPPN